MRDASVKPRLQVASTVLGLFGLFKGRAKDATPPAAPQAPPPAPVPLAPPAAPVVHHQADLRGSVRFQGLHEDVNPAASVRPNHMTCAECGHSFRYFTNSSGSKTLTNCPMCGRQYRV